MRPRRGLRRTSGTATHKGVSAVLPRLALFLSTLGLVVACSSGSADPRCPVEGSAGAGVGGEGGKGGDGGDATSNAPPCGSGSDGSGDAPRGGEESPSGSGGSTQSTDGPEGSGGIESSGTCCRVCSTGKACGDSCINHDLTCHQSPGCACDG